MDNARRNIKKYLPKQIFSFFQPYYHFLLAYWGAVKYNHPSKSITVIGVTGTKGKSSTVEILSHLLRSDKKKVASLSTIQFSIDGKVEKNLFKMTMPGRFFVQKFLRQAVDAGCTHAVVEMTSEGSKQFRHRFLDIDGLIFTNLSPEHIESHGSFDNYTAAKLAIAEAVEKSPKRPRYIVSNTDDEHGADFLKFEVENKLPYSLDDLAMHSLHKNSVSFVIEKTTIRVPLAGLFNVYNSLAAITLAKSLGMTLDTIEESLREMTPLKGRVEQFESSAKSGRNITVVVDYAHTTDSLTKLYETFPDHYKIGILGNTGGGRDTWKRPEMGAIAEKFCDEIILTNEDPYDEDPEKIVLDMKKGMSENTPVQIIMDRETAIRQAINNAPEGSYIIISGKGTDPYIMGPDGSKQPWSDADLVKEILSNLPTRKVEA